MGSTGKSDLLTYRTFGASLFDEDNGEQLKVFRARVTNDGTMVNLNNPNSMKEWYWTYMVSVPDPNNPEQTIDIQEDTAEELIKSYRNLTGRRAHTNI